MQARRFEHFVKALAALTRRQSERLPGLLIPAPKLDMQDVNAYRSRLRGWLQPFRSVASRYLGTYLGWRRLSLAARSRHRMPCCERHSALSTLGANSAFEKENGDEMNIQVTRLPLVALIGLGALTSNGAQAQSVEVYGLIGAYVGSIKRSGDTDSVRVVNSGGLQTSYLGIRGQEELGGGTKAIFSLEAFFRADTGEQGRSASDPLFSRNAWVGLDGRLGRLTLGRQTNPTYVTTGQLSPFGISVVFSPLVLHTFVAAYGSNIVGDTVWNNVIQYGTPEMGGFKASLVYGLGEVADREGLANLGMHASFRKEKFFAALSLQRVRVNVSTPLAVQQEAMVGGASYDFGKFKVFGSTSHTRFDEGRRNRLYDAGLSVALSGNTSLLMEVARTRSKLPGSPDTHRTTASLGYDYRLSKRSDVYLIYSHDKRSDAGSAGTTALAIRHLF